MQLLYIQWKLLSWLGGIDGYCNFHINDGVKLTQFCLIPARGRYGNYALFYRFIMEGEWELGKNLFINLFCTYLHSFFYIFHICIIHLRISIRDNNKAKLRTPFYK